MIDLTDKTNSDPTMSKILVEISDKAVGIVYTSTEPTASTVPQGKIVIYDNGSGTKRLYVRTGQNNIGYVALT